MYVHNALELEIWKWKLEIVKVVGIVLQQVGVVERITLPHLVPSGSLHELFYPPHFCAVPLQATLSSLVADSLC